MSDYLTKLCARLRDTVEVNEDGDWYADPDCVEAADLIEKFTALADAVREFTEDDGGGGGYPSPIDTKYEAVLTALAAVVEGEQ